MKGSVMPGSVRALALALPVALLLGCLHARAEGPGEGDGSKGGPATCDDIGQLPNAYFGKRLADLFGTPKPDEGFVQTHAQFLCRARETPLSAIDQSRFVRCVWYEAFEDPMVISVGDACVVVSRKITEAGGEYRVEESRQALARPNCTKLLDAAISAARTGAGRSLLAPGQGFTDGNVLFFEYRDAGRSRAGWVDMPDVGSGASGAVKACVLAREAIRKTPGPQSR